jgi:hypothetical protein
VSDDTQDDEFNEWHDGVPIVPPPDPALTDGGKDDSGEYDSAAEIQKFIDDAVEKHGEKYVAENIDGLLAGLRPVMSVDKDELDIPAADQNPEE